MKIAAEGSTGRFVFWAVVTMFALLRTWVEPYTLGLTLALIFFGTTVVIAWNEKGDSGYVCLLHRRGYKHFDFGSGYKARVRAYWTIFGVMAVCIFFTPLIQWLSR